MYKREYLEVFLNDQLQLFDEKVADTPKEAEEFLEEVREYFEESGMDASELSDDELADASEVFALPDGRFLVVEA